MDAGAVVTGNDMTSACDLVTVGRRSVLTIGDGASAIRAATAACREQVRQMLDCRSGTTASNALWRMVTDASSVSRRGSVVRPSQAGRLVRNG